MSVHDGHRERMRKRFLEQGIDGFAEHEALEMLLYYTNPRKDTNALAHALISEFGSFARVLEASVTDLQKVPGVGPQTAMHLNYIGSAVRYYHISKAEEHGTILSSVEQCISYMRPLFVGRQNEAVYLLCLDAKCKQLACKLLGEGSVNSTAVPIRRIVETALATNATSVILAHNHPSGVAFPSNDDVATTKVVANALQAVDIILADHLVFADDECVSMVQSELFDPKTGYILI